MMLADVLPGIPNPIELVTGTVAAGSEAVARTAVESVVGSLVDGAVRSDKRLNLEVRTNCLYRVLLLPLVFLYLYPTKNTHTLYHDSCEISLR